MFPSPVDDFAHLWPSLMCKLGCFLLLSVNVEEDSVSVRWWIEYNQVLFFDTGHGISILF